MLQHSPITKIAYCKPLNRAALVRYLHGVVGVGVHDHGEKHGLEGAGAFLFDGPFERHAVVTLVVMLDQLPTRGMMEVCNKEEKNKWELSEGRTSTA